MPEEKKIHDNPKITITLKMDSADCLKMDINQRKDFANWLEQARWINVDNKPSPNVDSKSSQVSEKPIWKDVWYDIGAGLISGGLAGGIVGGVTGGLGHRELSKEIVKLAILVVIVLITCGVGALLICIGKSKNREND